MGKLIDAFADDKSKEDEFCTAKDGYTAVLVEAPGKVKKIQSIFNKIEKGKYKVAATVGHCIDLPEKELGVDLVTMEPEYVVMSKKSGTVRELKTLLNKAGNILVATDPDREGEMIGYSIINHLKPKIPVNRITYQSIDQRTISKSLQNMRDFNMALVDAQKARRVLDRVVGYKMSPLLWQTIRPGLSAGRVQSAALRMLCEREEERNVFVPEIWWTVDCNLDFNGTTLAAQVVRKNGEKVDFKTEEEANQAIEYIRAQSLKVSKIQSKQKSYSPQPPFTTSTFQQAVASVLNLGGKMAMSTAQSLYEAGLCLHPDELVCTPTGQILTIREFVQNRNPEIIGLDNEIYKSSEISCLNYFEKLAPSTMYQIRTPKNLSIISTEDHPFLVLDEEANLNWKKASELKDGDFVATQKKIEITKSKEGNIIDLLSNLSLEEQREILVCLDMNLPEHLLACLQNVLVNDDSLAESTTYKHLRLRKTTLENYFKIRKFYPEIDMFYRALHTRAASADPIAFNFIITPEFCRLIGLILGDGSIQNNLISIIKPDITQEVFTKYCKCILNYKVNKSNSLPKIFAIILKALGYSSGSKSSILFIPKFIMELDDECVKGFIAGLWDSDGSICKHSERNSCHLSYSSRSEKFIKQLRIMLLRLGIYSSFFVEKQSNINKRNAKYAKKNNRSQICAKGNQYYLHIFSDSWKEFYVNIGKYLINRRSQVQIVNETYNLRTYSRDKRDIFPIFLYIDKLRKAKNITKQKFSQDIAIDYWNYFGKVRKNRNRQSYFNAELINKIGNYYNDRYLMKLGKSDICWQPITVEKLDNSLGQVCEKVYDLTNNLHNFMCSGFVVHNCTYHRTDSTSISEDGMNEIRNYITNTYDEKYRTAQPVTYVTRQANAQEAHECIRPVHMVDGGSLPMNQRRVYDLVFHKAAASQMQPYISESKTVVIVAGDYELECKGSTIVFDGWLREYPYINRKEVVIPTSITEDSVANMTSIKSQEHATEPPPRFTQASIIKAFEENGIGRPATYDSIISVLEKREYIVLDKKQFVPTDLGKEVSNQLKESFPQIVNLAFTAKMEEALDTISRGEMKYCEYLTRFWAFFKKQLDTAKLHETKESEHDCPKCGKKMMIRFGKFGKFLACPDKECKTNLSMNPDGSIFDKEKDKIVLKTCDKEGCNGEMTLKSGRFGKFFGCSNYPTCKNMLDALGNPIVKKEAEKTGTNCPKCSKPLVIREGKRGKFNACSGFPKCKYIERKDAEEGTNEKTESGNSKRPSKKRK